MVAWNRADLTLMWRQEISKQGNGVVLVKDLGTPLWVIKYKSIELPLLSAQSLHAEYETLGGSLRTFYAHTAKRPYPASVNPLALPSLAGATIHTLGGDTTSMRITEAGYGLLAVCA